jgi:hypothetical protein
LLVFVSGKRQAACQPALSLTPGAHASALEGIWLLRKIKHQAPDGRLIGDG